MVKLNTLRQDLINALESCTPTNTKNTICIYVDRDDEEVHVTNVLLGVIEIIGTHGYLNSTTYVVEEDDEYIAVGSIVIPLDMFDNDDEFKKYCSKLIDPIINDLLSDEDTTEKYNFNVEIVSDDPVTNFLSKANNSIYNLFDQIAIRERVESNEDLITHRLVTLCVNNHMSELTVGGINDEIDEKIIIHLTLVNRYNVLGASCIDIIGWRRYENNGKVYKSIYKDMSTTYELTLDDVLIIDNDGIVDDALINRMNNSFFEDLTSYVKECVHEIFCTINISVDNNKSYNLRYM